MTDVRVSAPSAEPVLVAPEPHLTPERAGTYVLGVVVAGAVAVTAMWLQNTPAHSLHTLGDELTAIGRITGLLGTYLVLVQVLLIARLPWLDRWIGMDRTARWHGLNGQYTVGLLVTHAVTVVMGYAATDGAGIWHETDKVIGSYPDVLIATIALWLLMLIGVVSARVARRRIKYHAWYFLHLSTYAAVLLAFPHEFATGNEFAAHPGYREFWVILHVLVFTLLVGYRILVPLVFTLRHRLEVADVVDETDDVTSIYVTGRRLEDLRAQAGQFFFWRFMTSDRWWEAHPFSLSAPPDSEYLRITVKAAGDYTSTRLRQVPVGTRVVAEGPYGSLTAQRRSLRKVLFLAGGTGVTPLRALFESIPAEHGDLSFLYRAVDEDSLVLREELETLAVERGARLVYLLGGLDVDPDPLAPDQLLATVPDIAQHDVYACGPPGFVDHAVDSVRRCGVPLRHIHTERFEF